MPDEDGLPPDGHPVTRRKNSGTYATPHGTFRSVTTILGGGIPKPALVHWAAREVADCAITHLPYLSKIRGRPAREAAYTWLRMAAERKRNDAAALGSEVHQWAEARILGTPHPEPSERAKPVIAGFELFLDEWLPSFEATELIVANTVEGYAGTADAWLRLRGLGFTMIIVDYKSGRGVWPEAPLQVCAYNHADVAWLPNGTEVEPPTAERGFVLHLRPLDDQGHGYAKGYAMIPVDIGDETWAQFLHARNVDAGARHRAAAVGDPMDLPPLPDLPDLPLPKVS